MTANWIEKLTGSLEGKKEYRAYRARVRELPTPYRTCVEAVERYLTYAGGITDGATLVRMLNDLADLFERAAVDGTPVRRVVGDDPVEFAEDFVRSYSDAQWISKERARLTAAIDAAARLERQ